MRAAAIGGGALVCANAPLAAVAAPATSQTSPRPGGVLRVGAADPPSRWDLHASGSGRLFDFTASVFNTLIAEDPADPTGQTIVPDLGADWEVSDDGLTYTFPLRTDIL